MKPAILPGETFNLRIVREGKDKGQGVGYLPDGTIEYLGRSDHQVKIRGLRIELVPGEAVYLVRPDRQAEARRAFLRRIPADGRGRSEQRREVRVRAGLSARQHG